MAPGPDLLPARKTSGVKQPCSTSLILWSFSFLLLMYPVARCYGLFAIRKSGGIKTLTLKNRSCSLQSQKPLAIMSTWASSILDAMYCNFSPVDDNKVGSMPTQGHNSERSCVNVSLMSFRRINRKAPHGQLIGCLTCTVKEVRVISSHITSR